MPINKIDLDQLLNQARVNLVGASDAGLRGEFYDTLTEFLNDSSIWTQDVFILTQNNVFSYGVFVPEGTIVRLVGVNDVGTTQPAPGALIQPVFVPALMPDVGTIRLKSVPASPRMLMVTVVTNVALPTDKNMLPQAPDWLLPIWHVGILDGLLGKMMLQPNKSYTDKTQGAYHLKRFRDAISRARVSKLRANTVGAAAWRFPQQFRSVSQQGGVPSVGTANERVF